ncbi:MAG TPA: hypothetical protein VKC53_04255 [Patescibacteria group bacterium]|nr:hypothetical protein [Patescibacteria group bacterium]
MTVNEKVTVGMVDNVPKYVIWKGQSHTVVKIGLHHTFRDGKTMHHIFSVTSSTLFMRLNLNSDNLIWTLEEIENNGF